ALHVELVSLEGPRQVPSGASGTSLAATATLDARNADRAALPGAAGRTVGDGPDTIPVLLGRAVESGLAAAVGPALARTDAVVATVCGGSLILAMAGLLSGRNAVTHHLGMQVLAATGAR